MRIESELPSLRANNLATAMAKVVTNFNGGKSEHPIVILSSNDEDVVMLLDQCTTNEFLNLVLQAIQSMIERTSTMSEAETRMSVIKDLFDSGYASMVKSIREGDK